MDDSK